MNDAQRIMLFRWFARVAQREGWHTSLAREIGRERLTIELFKAPRSWAQFTNPDVDRMKRFLITRLAPHDLQAQMELAKMEEHDAAQAAHVPEIAPGKRFYQLRKNPRREQAREQNLAARLEHPSIYEQQTAVDDPCERRRLVYFIERLFAPALIRHFAVNIDDTARWEELPLPQLAALRDNLRNRLGKWLTKHKATHDFGFSVAARNPRARGPWMSNDEIIAELLKRAIIIDMAAKPRSSHRESGSPAAASRHEAADVEIPF